MRWGGFFDVEGLRLEVERLDRSTSLEGFWDDAEAAQLVLAERARAERKIKALDNARGESESLLDLLEMATSERDEGMLAEVIEATVAVQRSVEAMELERMLAGKYDANDAIVTIHPGAGGVDAQDWAEMLMRMYLRWCERQSFSTELIDQQEGDEAGIKSVSFVAKGEYAYGKLRAESGVHRLIRISPFDANARRHTAFAAVSVVPDLPEDDEEQEIRSEDLRVDTFRAGGAGGQHINRTESAIRITHLPTGVVVQCQAERSQHKNRATAMKMLRGRLYELQRQQQEAEFSKNFESNQMAINFGSQVRTYTLAPYQLVKDERTEYKSSNVDAVLAGDISGFIDAYLLASAEKKHAEELALAEEGKEA